MVYRLSWIAGGAGVALALFRLERLLRSTSEGVPWELVLIAAAVLGAAITWAGTAYRLDGRLVALANLAAMLVTVVRIAVPATTWFVFPTLASFGELRFEIEFAQDVIRKGVAPVIPLAGVIAILAVVFWCLGALLSWGLLTGRPYLAVLAPLVVYLQFATMDRRPSAWWLWLFLLFLGGALLAVALDRRRHGTGLLTSSVSRLAMVRSLPSLAVGALVVTMAVALLTTNAVADLVPRSGVLDWRVQSGLTGDYYGGVSYNPFVGIQQGLVSQTNTPVFVAAAAGDVEAERVYWRLLTLETFSGSQWLTDKPRMSLPDEIDSYETEAQRFRGPTATVTQDVTILALQMDWLPAAYAPIEMTAQNRAVERGFRVKDDGSLRFDALSYRGMTYEVTSEVPQPDLNVLSAGDDGELSRVFAGAAEEGEFELDLEEDEPLEIPEPVELADPEPYLALPDDIDPGVASLAREQTRGLTTDYERAIALEAFFRSPGQFRYSIDIAPGHSAQDLSGWLLDPSSINYRTGYCEQFATSMAVMARQLEIPSRVVLGFTPGTPLEDGRVVVRDRNAHAWVELWMPTQGWVRFDPTPRGDGINPATLADLPFDIEEFLVLPEEPDFQPIDPGPGGAFLPQEDDPNDLPLFIGAGGDEPVGRGFTLPGWVIPSLIAMVVAFGLLPGFKWLRRRLRLRRLARGDVGAAWAEIVDRLEDLGAEPLPAATPREVAVSTDDAMIPLADVYGMSVYGPPDPPWGVVAVAGRSLTDTEQRLSTRYSVGRRLVSRYTLRSVLPRWLRRVLRRD